MDLFKRNLAPIPEYAWAEITDRARQVITSNLTSRKVFNFYGPKGIDYTALSEGRIGKIDQATDGEVKTGIYEVKPLVEARISFLLNRWELDNIVRGAKDIELEPLEEAAKKIALFEENAVYKGYEGGSIKGLEDAVEQEAIPFGDDSSNIMEGITQGIIMLKEAFVEPPITLIVGKEAWKLINKVNDCISIWSRINNLTEGDIVYSTVVDGAYLIPANHDDLELTVGQDFAIGYESHDNNAVRLFITESFTFRVLDPMSIVKFTL